MVLPLSPGFHSWRWRRDLGAWRGVLEDRLEFYRVRRREKKWIEKERSLGAVHEERWVCVVESHCSDFPSCLAFSSLSEYQSLWVCLGCKRALSEWLLIWGAACIWWLTDKCYMTTYHFCSLMDNCNSNSLQHCQLSCWKLCQAYIKDKFLPLLPFPYKSVNGNKYLASQTVSASASRTQVAPGKFWKNRW